MAFQKAMQQNSEEFFKIEVIKGYSEIKNILDGVEYLDRVLLMEGFVLHYLEGSDYEESKKMAYKVYGDSGKFFPKAIGKALCKLQQREARLAGIYGKVGLLGVPDGPNADKVISSLKSELENPEAVED